MKKNLLPAACMLFCSYAYTQVPVPDSSFGVNGIQLTTIAHYPGNPLQESAMKLLPVPDGGFIMVLDRSTNSQPATVMVKYFSNSAIDHSFGIDGYSAATSMIATDAVLQPDGKIIVVGYDPQSLKTSFVVARYNANGSPDPSFSGDGILSTHSVDFNSMDRATGVALQGSKVVVAGNSVNDGNYQFTVCRYTADGEPDITFGINGIQTTGFSDFQEGCSVAGLIIQQEKIVVAGTDTYGEFAIVRFNADGSLDESFGPSGLRTTAFAFTSDAEGIAAQGDKIVVAGYSNYEFAVARYNYDGSLDNSFSGDGKLTTSFQQGFAEDVAIRGSKIIVGGNYLKGFAIAQYNDDGSLDSSFSGDGKLTTQFNYVDFVRANTMALQGDQILMAGQSYFYDTSKNVSIYDFAIARYHADGSLDNDFSQDGMLTGHLLYARSSFANAVIQDDEKIIAVGTAIVSDAEREDFFVARHNKNGSPDNTFDMDGIQTTSFESPDVAHAVAVKMQGDKIVVAGTSSNISNLSGFAVVRYKANGSLDSSFGNNGKVITVVNANSNLFARALAIQGDKIVVTGYMYDFATDRNALVVARYNADGSPDNTFSQDGLAITHFSNNSNDLGNFVAIQGDKILVAGESYSPPANNIDFFIVRYNADGTPDNSFNGTGFQLTDFGSFDEARTIQVKPDAIIVAGSRGPDGINGPMVAIAHYNNDGTLDTSYDGDGKSQDAFPLAIVFPNSFSFGDNGKLYVAGSNGNGDQSIFRYGPDGHRDITFHASNPFLIETLVPANDRLYAIGSQATGNVTVGAIAAYKLGCVNSWTGAVNNLWENAANWSCGTVPGENSDVVISSGKTVQVNSNVTIRSLQLNPAVAFTVAAGYHLTVTH